MSAEMLAAGTSPAVLEAVAGRPTATDLVVEFLSVRRGQRFTARQIAAGTGDTYSSRSVVMACQRLVAHGRIQTEIHRPTRYLISKNKGGAA